MTQVQRKKTSFYNGNPLLKKAGVPYQFSEYEISELMKCAGDIKYFVKTYCKIVSLDKGIVDFDIFDFQEEMLDAFLDNRFVVNLLARQNGKTTIVAAYLLYKIIFSKNINIAILANKSAAAVEVLDRIKLMYENLPWFLQVGVVTWNKRYVELGNGCKVFAASTTSSSIRGQSINCVSGDTKVTFSDDIDAVYHCNIDSIYAKSSKYIHKSQEDDMMYYTVYKITNKINGKIYIGFHKTDNLDDGYMGSGKLIKLAIEKYGVYNFEKEYIDIFDNKEDAEFLESQIVDSEFTLRDDTYNIALGGNVRVMIGENNPFYGKYHSLETKKMIGLKSLNRVTGSGYKLICDGIEYDSMYQLKNKNNMTYSEFNLKMKAGDIRYLDVALHENYELSRHNAEIKWQYSKIKLSDLARERFTGIKKTADHKEKIRNAHIGTKKPWVADKVNKNPDKIKKTSEKHKGMKRTAESRETMSKSKKEFLDNYGTESIGKGSIYIHNAETHEIKRVDKNYEFNYPWIRGSGEKSESFKSKLSDRTKNTKFMYNDEIDKMIRVNPDDVEKYILLGYIIGKRPCKS